ncbi:MAG: NifU family protein [Deltaproteobacteria bacterium]|nr:NifU family protein [Deltaproteobacteria bacterium]MBW2255319.1 NifU family protein [Deltaproteobacteria bacterium]
MSLFTTIKTALGLIPPLAPKHPEPFQLSANARKRIDQFAPGRALHVATVPAAGGYTVRAWEGSDGMLEEGVAPVVISEEDHERLAGTTLDWDGERWTTRARLAIQATETPNPNGRKYETDRYLALGRPQGFSKGDETAPPLAQRILGIEGIQNVLVYAHTLTVERETEASWAATDREVEAQLREYFLLCGQALPDPGTAEPGTDLEGDVLRVLQEHALPYIRSHGGNLELVDIREGVVRLHLEGACGSCPASQITLKVGVERALLEALPGRVVRVEAV